MDAKRFKETYLKWSKAVIITAACLLNAIVLCDHFLGFDFSKNMYMMSFISTGVVLAFLSISWISVLNLESRFLRAWHTNVIDDADEITLESIAECVRKEGYAPEIDQENNAVQFKIQGEPHRITYADSRFCMYKSYVVLEEKTDIDLLKKAILSAEENVFGLKVFYREYEDGRKGIIFQFSSLFASNAELNKHFSRCLSILDKGIAFHREKYDEYHDSAQKELSGMTCREHPEHRNLS